ncbi:MAG: DUF4214 domain-containing protein [Opitutaceae bacterium]
MHGVLGKIIAQLAFLGALAEGGASLTAQNAATVNPNHVTFFTEPNFQGESLKVEAGAAVANLERLLRANQQPWLGAISSVRIAGDARASVFSQSDQRGDRLEITRDIPDLYAEARGADGGNWDRAIISLSVTGSRGAVTSAAAEVNQPANIPVTTAPPPAPPPDAPRQVIVVQQPPPSPPRAPVIVAPPRPRIDRRTAEMIVDRAYREVLDRPADPEGLRRYRDRIMFEGWSQRQMIEQLQRSDEARAINPDVAIKRMYREILGRDPDANGLAHYRSKWRQGWTQGQIRADLQRSREGQGNQIRDVITRAYRDVLGRDPDPAGYANYERLMRERGYTERDIRRALMNGDEYRQRMRATK